MGENPLEQAWKVHLRRRKGWHTFTTHIHRECDQILNLWIGTTWTGSPVDIMRMECCTAICYCNMAIRMTYCVCACELRQEKWG
jgi:hypothetical protein